MTAKRVFIVEDEANTRAFLSMVVAEHPKLELLTAQGSLSAARAALRRYTTADVFLVDLGLPDGNGIDFIRDIRRKHAHVPVMVLSVFGDERSVVDAIACGAGGYIHKDGALKEIGRHIEEVLSGDSPISPSVARHILTRMQQQSSPEKPSDTTLTQRELDVLNILSRGFSREEASEHLKISRHTITTHIKSIYRKLNVHSCTEALFEASQLGLINNRSSHT